MFSCLVSRRVAVSSFISHACSLDYGLRFLLSSAWGLFLKCFRFARCVALGHVVTSAFPLCGVVACVFLLFLPCLGKGVVIFTFWRERELLICCVFSCSHIYLSGSTLRVPPAETRLTVYRRSNIKITIYLHYFFFLVILPK